MDFKHCLNVGIFVSLAGRADFCICFKIVNVLLSSAELNVNVHFSSLFFR